MHAITFQVNTIDPSLLSSNLPDENIENILNQWRNATVWVETVNRPLKHGDRFTLYGRQAFHVRNLYQNFNKTVQLITVPSSKENALSIRFDGSFYLENTDPIDLPITNEIRAIFGWVKPHVNQTLMQVLFGYGSSDSQSNKECFMVYNTGTYHDRETTYWADSNGNYITPNFPENMLIANKWNLVGMTFDETTVYVSLNGLTWPTDITLATVAEFIRIGFGPKWNFGRDNLFIGDIRAVGVWNDYLTPEEIAELYHARFQPAAVTTPVVYELLPANISKKTELEDLEAVILEPLVAEAIIEDFLLTSSSETIDVTEGGSLIAHELVFGNILTSEGETLEVVSSFEPFITSNDENLQLARPVSRLTSFWNLSEDDIVVDSLGNNDLTIVSTAADFSMSSSTIPIGESISFTDESILASSWLWDFGDGTTSTEQNPVHTYSGSSATYAVTLVVDDQTAYPATHTITVLPPAYIYQPMQGETLTGTLHGNALYLGDSLRLTSHTNGVNGAIDYNNALNGVTSFTAYFDLYADGSADAIWFNFFNEDIPVLEEDPDIHKGYTVYFDEYHGTIAIVNDGEALLVSDGFSYLGDATWRTAKIEYSNKVFSIYLNDVLIMNLDDFDNVRDLSGTHVGLGSRTGAASALHLVKQFIVVQ